MAAPATSEVNLELLIKLLKMTTSSVDGEALTAMRKANEQLLKVGGDWENLLRGKVKVIADPFGTVAKPQPSPKDRWGAPSGSAPPRPQPSPPPRPSTSWQASSPSFNQGGAQTGRFRSAAPPPPKTGMAAIVTRPNAFSGHCYACGVYVNTQAGWIFQKPGANRWEVLCATCSNSSAPLPSKRAKVQQASTSSIFNNI